MESRSLTPKSTEENSREAPTRYDHPFVFQSDRLENLQQLGARCTFVPFAVGRYHGEQCLCCIVTRAFSMPMRVFCSMK